MAYVIGVLVVLFIAYKIVIGLGRKNAKDVLVANYGLNRAKLDKLSDPQITSLTFSLDSFARKGEFEALNALAQQYK